MNDIITIKSLSKSYDNGLIQALKDINLSLQEGKIYALMGASGCGKSTLLNIIGTLDEPSNGEVLYEGKKINNVGPMHNFRRNFIGFIFQFHHLIPVLSLRENVEATMLSNTTVSASKAVELAGDLLKEMGLAARMNSYASSLSGGERQRGAIARALVNQPKLLLADEPTGNVDSKTAEMILRLFKAHIKKSVGSILIATHDAKVAAIADVVIEMEDGKIISIKDKAC